MAAALASRHELASSIESGAPEPKSLRGAATRRRLIVAARDELVERDGQLEVDPVAARAGVSVGSIYRHFGSRAGLVEAVVDDFYQRYRSEALEAEPLPGTSLAERERRRTELTVAFHYADPLAPIILSSLHLDPLVAVEEAAQIDAMIELMAGVMQAGQERDELPGGRDPRFVGAMLIGGMRHVLAIALGSDPVMAQEETTEKLWVLVAGVMGL